LRTSNTSGHTCMQAPVDAQLSKSTVTFMVVSPVYFGVYFGV
jgi:hypothetical protein